MAKPRKSLLSTKTSSSSVLCAHTRHLVFVFTKQQFSLLASHYHTRRVYIFIWIRSSDENGEFVFFLLLILCTSYVVHEIFIQYFFFTIRFVRLMVFFLLVLIDCMCVCDANGTAADRHNKLLHHILHCVLSAKK